MSTGEDIYDRLTRVSNPVEFVRELDDMELRKLLDELELIPAGGGFPLLAGAVVDEEVQRRFQAATKKVNHESDGSN